MMACLEASFLESWWTMTAALFTTTYDTRELTTLVLVFSFQILMWGRHFKPTSWGVSFKAD